MSSQTRRRGGDAGFTFVELMIAIVVVALSSTVLIGHLAINYSTTQKQRENVFAFMAAKSLLAEIHSHAGPGLRGEEVDVDQLDDGAAIRPTLSIARRNDVLVDPDHVLSNNIRRNGQWLWGRRVSVRPLPGLNNRNLRYVTVRIYKRDGDGRPLERASLSSVVTSLSEAFPTTQVYDVYFIAIENIPGWWVHMESIRPFMESMVTDLERSNPGLVIRSHWITKADYGRDPLYRPYINAEVDSLAPIPDVYHYPGLMPEGNASAYYYVPSLLRGRIATDEGEQNGYDAVANPYPYALADYWNHAMREPAARAFHTERVANVRSHRASQIAAVLDGFEPPDDLDDMSVEPTLRLLLDDMQARPDDYRNALLINLHGELLPMPSIRNYSDAARDPIALPSVRVVTHPEELRTQRPPAATGAADVRLRVYSWVTEPWSYTGDPYLPPTRPIALQVMDLDLTNGARNTLYPGVRVDRLVGGVAGNAYRPLEAAPLFDGSGGATPPAGQMACEVSFEDPGPGRRKYTLIKLWGSPVVAPQVGSKGLYANTRSRLYGMEYVPSCTGGGLDFSRDLASDGDGPKNTARWVVTIPGDVFAGQRWVTAAMPPTYFDPRATSEPDPLLTVRTRIWDPDLPDPRASGTTPRGSEDRLIAPYNLSETYTWWAASRSAVPFSERSQFLGDPRHNPYRDLLRGDPDFGDGYNWYFDSLQNGGQNAAADFPGLDRGRLRNRWKGRLRQDVPRYFELLRTALVEARAVYTTLTGFSYYYMGHGNEIGYDSANGYPKSIPIDLTPFGGSGAGFENNITGSRKFVRRGSGASWWSMPWLGELFPDDVYATQWAALDANGDVRGNLSAGRTATSFHQAKQRDVYAASKRSAYGTRLDTAIQRTQNEGCTSFFNIGTSSRTFHHQFESKTGTLNGPGLELANNYNVSLPPSASITRPFNLASSGSGGVGDEWSHSPYASRRSSARLLETYYRIASSNTASGIVELTDSDASNAAFVVVNGLAQTTTVGVDVISKFSLLTLLHSYFESGEPGRRFRTKLVPRIQISHPTEITELANPARVPVRFDLEWRRWDGARYTASTPNSFAEAREEIRYAILVSRDNGDTWVFAQDGEAAEPGENGADDEHLVVDLQPGEETYLLPTPAIAFPSGSYLVRVEAYRAGQVLHYAYHQRRFFVDR